MLFSLAFRSARATDELQTTYIFISACQEPIALAFVDECACDVVHRRQIGEGVEPAVVRDVFRGPNDPAPGGACERPADADPLHAQILELTLSEARPAGEHVDR